MTSLLILDIFISLSFLYLTYSLLASFLSEWISSALRFRAENLRRAIFRMLSDEEIPPFYKVASYSKPLADGLYNNFINSPSIKYLGKRKGKPSSISSNTFSDTLIEILAEESQKAISENSNEVLNPYDKFTLVKATVEQNYEVPIAGDEDGFYIGNQTQIQLRRILEKSKNSMDLFKSSLEEWYNETTERSRGWYQSKMRILNFILGFVLAIAFNLDSIHIVLRLSKDPKALQEIVAMSESLEGTNLEAID